MLLAQIREIGDAAQRQLDRAADFGFASYVLILVVVLFSIAAGVHFFYIVKPDTEARRESAKSRDKCLESFSENYAVQTLLLKEVAADLSAISKEVGLTRSGNRDTRADDRDRQADKRDTRADDREKRVDLRSHDAAFHSQ